LLVSADVCGLTHGHYLVAERLLESQNLLLLHLRGLLNQTF
jgi:hypothetical protein